MAVSTCEHSISHTRQELAKQLSAWRAACSTSCSAPSSTRAPSPWHALPLRKRCCERQPPRKRQKNTQTAKPFEMEVSQHGGPPFWHSSKPRNRKETARCSETQNQTRIDSPRLPSSLSLSLTWPWVKTRTPSERPNPHYPDQNGWCT